MQERLTVSVHICCKLCHLGKDRYGGNIIVDFDKRDDNKTNSNALILGNSGQGKSYLLKLIAYLLQAVPRPEGCFRRQRFAVNCLWNCAACGFCAPSVVKFYADYFICGNTFRCVWALREYPHKHLGTASPLCQKEIYTLSSSSFISRCSSASPKPSWIRLTGIRKLKTVLSETDLLKLQSVSLSKQSCTAPSPSKLNPLSCGTVQGNNCAPTAFQASF